MTTRQDTSVSPASHLNRALLVQPHVCHGQQHVLVQRLHLPLALQVLTLRYQLGEQAQTQRRCSQRNPRVTALQRTKARAAAARCCELWRPTAHQFKM